MSKSKLRADYLERYAFDTWAIRFAGDSFMDLIGCFHKEGVEHTRWVPDALDDKGAWVIDDSVLVRYADWFENLDVRLDIMLNGKREDIKQPE